jgi:hypothetical protein
MVQLVPVPELVIAKCREKIFLKKCESYSFKIF